VKGVIRRLCGSLAVATGLMVALTADQQPQQNARFVAQHDWVGKGQWIRGDTHVHTRFSDGGYSPADVATQAVKHGCEVIGFPDHAARRLKGASPEYMAAIQAVRKAQPALVVIAGLEWNVPPFGGDEHATLLVAEGPREESILAEFKRRFDDSDVVDSPKPDVQAALTWLAQTTAASSVKPVVIYNHPSRKDASSMQNVDDIVSWRKVNDLVIGFESGVGHQGSLPLGSYDQKISLVDRWDPVAARTGDAWDTLLQRNVDVHGAMASSDFHTPDPRDLNDFWPCQFSETWFYVPEKTTSGVLQAIRAGTFVGVHGQIARQVEFSLSAPGLARPAVPGERIEVSAGTTITAEMSLDVPRGDWAGRFNRVDAIEFIVVTPKSVEVKAQPISGVGAQRASERITVGPEGVVVRARGRRIVPDGPDLMFYTNAIRVSAVRPLVTQ